MRPRLVLIAAVAENGVIGRDNAMPWRLPSDLRHFKALTLGKPVIMGRRTFESIGRPLPGRDNIVVSAKACLAGEGVHVARSLDGALALGERLARQRGVDEICVIGGSRVYAPALERADRLEITEVHARPEGDTRFPAIDPAQWRERAREGPIKGDRDSAAVSFVTYERIAR